MNNPYPNKKYNPDLDIITHRKNLVALNFIEDPVDIWTFLSSPQYLGAVTENGMGIYPVWRQALKDMFSDNFKTIIVLTGSTGTGKSTIAIYALLYIQYRLMILKDPWKFFKINYSGKMAISFFNLNRTLSDSRGYAKLQAFMAMSPWFREHAINISKTKGGKEELEFKLIKYLLSSPYSQGGGIIGEDVVSGILDEVDAPSASKSQKERVVDTYEATAIRFKNRFAQTGYSLGKLFIVSSKQEETAFVETFVAERRNLPEVLIFDINVWEAKPDNVFCGKKFLVAVGDAYNPPKIMADKKEIERMTLEEINNLKEKFIKEGYKVIEVPIEFESEFKLDLLRSLRDIAGITVAGLRKFKLFGSEKFILDCFDSTKLDPVKVPTINIGLDDSEELLWFLDLTRIRIPKHVPRFIHLDISFSQDASGLAMSCIKDWVAVDVQNPDGTYRKEMAPVIETDFIMRIKAREGNRIPIHKIRKFILDLKGAGFNISKFTADLRLASEDTLQLLRSAGINADYFSVNTSMQPYFDFRNLVYEKRWVCHKHTLLFSELKHLEQDVVNGSIDHPEKVQDIEFLEEGGIKEVIYEGTKDLSDAVTGSVVQCLTNKKSPMNAQLLTEVLKNTAPKDINQGGVGNLYSQVEGKDIIGVKEGNNVVNIVEMFKKLHKNK